VNIDDQARWDKEVARAKRLGYRLINRADNYLLWRVDQPTPLLNLSYTSLDELTEELDNIEAQPRWSLDLSTATRELLDVAASDGLALVTDRTDHIQTFLLWPGEWENGRLVVHSSQAPRIGSWEQCPEP
jgi:hypothetical protein